MAALHFRNLFIIFFFSPLLNYSDCVTSETHSGEQPAKVRWDAELPPTGTLGDVLETTRIAKNVIDDRGFAVVAFRRVSTDASALGAPSAFIPRLSSHS